MTLIIGGALLLRYPPPIKNIGMSMVKIGIAYIGWEYYDNIMDYLIEHHIIDQKIDIKKE